MHFESAITRFEQHTILIMAGGTGGHVYPAMAVADYLKAHGWKIVWLVTEGGMENRLIENKGYVTAVINMRGVRGKGLRRWLSLPLDLVKAMQQAGAAIWQHAPDVVLGMGGFAAFPGGVMAKCRGIPLIIHEQNSVPGLTNRILSLIANQVLTAFPGVLQDKAVQVGNPVRDTITQAVIPEMRYQAREGALRLLILGGSLGAAALNEILPKALAQLPESRRPQVMHQAGEKHIAELEQQYANVGVKAETKAFIQNMAEAYAWADLVICRAGALTIAELACVGVASVLVPFPYAVDDHQTINARYLSEHGAAILVAQHDFTLTYATELLKQITREVCLMMAVNARKLATPEATERVAKLCMDSVRMKV